mgnify:CR=1
MVLRRPLTIDLMYRIAFAVPSLASQSPFLPSSTPEKITNHRWTHAHKLIVQFGRAESGTMREREEKKDGTKEPAD